MTGEIKTQKLFKRRSTFAHLEPVQSHNVGLVLCEHHHPQLLYRAVWPSDHPLKRAPRLWQPLLSLFHAPGNSTFLARKFNGRNPLSSKENKHQGEWGASLNHWRASCIGRNEATSAVQAWEQEAIADRAAGPQSPERSGMARDYCQSSQPYAAFGRLRE